MATDSGGVLTVEARARLSASPSTTGPRPEMRVAIAGTQTLLCEGLATYLKDQAGIRLIGSCTSIASMKDLADASRPDLLVIDWDLLGDVGMRDLRTITSNPRSPAIILLMAEEDRAATTLAMRLGASACVMKQDPLEDLLAAIRSISAGRMWISPALLTALFAEYRPAGEQLQAREQLNRLTPREMEVLRLLVAGSDRGAIAKALHVSNNTARTHVQNIEKKLSVHSVVAAVSVGLQAGLRPD